MHCCTRGPLRPVHAPFDAHGSSKPQGRSGLLLSRLEDPPPQSPYIPFHQDRQSLAARSRTSSGPFTFGRAPACAAAMVIGAQLALRFRFLPAGELHQLTCPRQRPFRSRGTRPRIRPVQSGRPAGGASHAARRFLPPFGHRHWLLRHVAPARGFCLRYLRLTGHHPVTGPCRGFLVPRARDTAGPGALCAPGTVELSQPASRLRLAPAASASGQSLDPAATLIWRGLR